MFEYCADTDCAYYTLAKPISSTVCDELLFIRQLFLPDLEPLKRFMSWDSYQNLLVNIGKKRTQQLNP